MDRDEGWRRRAHGFLQRTAAERFRVTFVVLPCALLVGCEGEAQGVPPTNPSPSSTIEASIATPATPAGLAVMPHLGEIVWATAIDPVTRVPTERVLSYDPGAPQIIAAATVRSLPAGSRLGATWEYNDTPLEPFTTHIVLGDSVDETWVTFHLERDPSIPWPEGKYEVTITFNESSIQRAAVEVTDQA